MSAVANDPLIIMGDFDAPVGKDLTSWPNVICKHGVGDMNSNGLMLLEFCTRFQLSIMGTMFQLKNSLKNTWQQLRSKHWQQIDHVLSNQAARQCITVTKVNRAADCFTDYKLLVSKCLFFLKQKKKGTRPPKKLDTRLDDNKRNTPEQFLDDQLSSSQVSSKILFTMQQSTNVVKRKECETTGLMIRMKKFRLCLKTRTLTNIL